MNKNRITQMEKRLSESLHPISLHIRDDSYLHISHVGAKDGRGHFHITIISERFEKQNQIARHRLIYQALGTLMQTDIHALQIDAKSPSEVE